MQPEQILKKLDWLDDERRRDKATIAALEEKIKSLEQSLQSAHQQIKEISAELSRYKPLGGRIDQTDEALLKFKVEVKQQLEALEKETQRREQEAEKLRRVEIKTLEASIAEIKKEISAIAELRRSLQTRIDEELRISRAITELEEKIAELERTEEEFNRLIRQSEDNRRQDARKITDLQGETTAIRKLYNELQAQLELGSVTAKRMESRMAEVEGTFGEIKQAQIKFIEEQSLLQVERERLWKEWLGRIEQFEEIAKEVEKTFQDVDATNRTVQRTQKAIEELAQKVERRVSELTELQRLGEERLRQEWVAFKSDDQKRWTNYTLVQEEIRSELVRQIDKIINQIGLLEENFQTVKDAVALLNVQLERNLRNLLNAVYNWAAEFDHTTQDRQ
ncbi:MAG: Chromosome partition protein smc [Anaerolineae bacterium]|nr:MAG: Chromosome partition protein smc [Anaerolineae bacterium]